MIFCKVRVLCCPVFEVRYFITPTEEELQHLQQTIAAMSPDARSLIVPFGITHMDESYWDWVHHGKLPEAAQLATIQCSPN